jgi:hypothetical protein
VTVGKTSVQLPVKHVRTGLPVHAAHEEEAVTVGKTSVQLPVKHVRTGLPVYSTHEEEATAVGRPVYTVHCTVTCETCEDWPPC